MKIFLTALFCFVGQIEPKHFAVQVASNEELKAWDYKFDSVAQFTEMLGQPSLKLLLAGKTDELYYALIRNDKTLLVVIWPQYGERFQRTTGSVTGPNRSDITLPNKSLLMPLLSTDVAGPEIDGITHRKVAVQLYAQSFLIKPEFNGIITVKYKVWNDRYRDGVCLMKNIPWDKN
jgi:hypothetical protein